MRSYKMKSPAQACQNPDLPSIIKLMMFRDAVLASIRWHDSLTGKDDLEDDVDRAFSIVCGAGWAIEATRFLKQLKRQRIITSEVIGAMPHVQPIDPQVVWADCVEAKPQAGVIRKLHAIRDKSFAHFDPALASAVIEDLASGDVDNVFVEWREKQNLKSRCTIAWMAIVRHMIGSSAQDPAQSLRELSKAVFSIGILLDHLLAAMIDKAGIEFEPCLPDSE